MSPKSRTPWTKSGTRFVPMACFTKRFNGLRFLPGLMCHCRLTQPRSCRFYPYPLRRHGQAEIAAATRPARGCRGCWQALLAPLSPRLLNHEVPLCHS